MHKMRMLLLLLLLAALGLGCGGQATLQPTQTVTVLSSPTFTAVPLTDTPIPPTDTPVPPTDTPIPPTETNTPLPPTPTVELPFVVIRIVPADGSLATQLAAGVQEAYALGYTPVVEFDATW